ncbi:MAG: DNA translocase FtsK 4TM domain-containing protein [Actinomycetes bacterium]|jgi:S-DNA-T family DNA segregation ATPase FtsK/SpoIIIE|nr:MAG: cell division protein FtsK [Actinomycetota bacterium]
MATRTPTRKGSGRRRVSPKKQRKQKKESLLRRMGRALAGMRTGLRQALGRQTDDVWGLILVVFGILVALAFFDLAGPVGNGIDTASRFLFGVWRFALPVALAGVGVAMIVGRNRDGARRLTLGGLTTYVGTLALFHLLTGAVALKPNIELVQERGGAVGALIAFPLRRILGHWGAFVVLAFLVGIGVLVMTRTTVRELFLGIAAMFRSLRSFASTAKVPVAAPQALAEEAPIISIPRGRHEKPRAKKKVEKVVDEPAPAPAARHARPKPKPVPARGGYQLPPLDLLEPGTGGEVNRKALEETARQLEETLLQHGVDATLTRITPGPTVTRYEIALAPGVKVNRVSNLAHDIAYALATPDIRLIVPIPGKQAIGVEVPNQKRRLVSLGDILSSPEAAKASHPLTVGLGMDISGTPKLLNLAELPHVLIAGATGAGKSSCINSIVTSLLMRTHPDDVRLILVDPKRVELGQYEGVPHLLTRVITNPKKANDALKWVVAEMDRRYDLLNEAKVRDIVGYREKLDKGQLDPEGFDRFPYIVVIIDELNDLMMVAGREVEESIVRIAQMARAVGIHLVIATQRPSVDVITGVIKANIPSRLAFSVASQTDSRVIIDSAGAEKLIGMGDMLVVTAKEPRPQRIQGSWVRESEVHAVVEWVKAQKDAEYEEKVLEPPPSAAGDSDEDEDEDADLIRQAMELVVRSQLGSTSMLQRKLRIGFARAGRVMDVLERKGVVGPSQGSKAREVLMTVEELEELLAGESATV